MLKKHAPTPTTQIWIPGHDLSPAQWENSEIRLREVVGGDEATNLKNKDSGQIQDGGPTSLISLGSKKHQQ